MNTCPVYRRSGGLSYGATYSGPIGVILDPTSDEFKYSELPSHSTLCGSCSDVCPVKIDISDQTFRWRRVMATTGYLPLTKRLSFAVAGHVLGHPEEYHAIEKVAGPAMDYAPHFLLYNRSLNPWGRSRELLEIGKQTFRDWYLANRSEDADVRICVLLSRLDRLPKKDLTRPRRMLRRIRLLQPSACPCRTIRSTE
jgi:L-lactate dehydrogenase complex protein LldF